MPTTRTRGPQPDGAEKTLRTADSDRTRPPAASLRYDTLADLYAAIPQVAELTSDRPRLNETAQDVLFRLRRSTTPEEAITFTAFAFVPKLSIWWGYECLRSVPEILTPLDREMMDGIATWIGQPSTSNRQNLMKKALWAPERCPGVHLGLAVGWSGGAIAPNDPAGVPLHRCPRAINTAVLTALAQVNISRRTIYLTRFMDVAQSLFKVY